MQPFIVVKVQTLSKKFTRSLKRGLWYGIIDIISGRRRRVSSSHVLRESEFWAFKNISFELGKGEALGILGSNGSGKSTLLRVITGVYPATEGRAQINGRVGSLIALGAGFHPHMTGRENILLNGMILGMTRAEVIESLDSIIAFAEIGPFIDSPVASYSSGMTVRLGFSIAIHSRPDVLIIDEVLAVGDIHFQRKCAEKILELRSQGVSALFVSHSISLLERMCTSGLVLDKGHLVFKGPIREAVKRYIDVTNRDQARMLQPASSVTDFSKVLIENVRVHNGLGGLDSIIQVGENIVIEFDYAFKNKLKRSYQIRLGLLTAEGREVQKFYFSEGSFADGARYSNDAKINLYPCGRASLTIKSPRLFPQIFRVDIAVSDMETNQHEVAFSNAASFHITEPVTNQYFEYGNMTITDFECSLELRELNAK